MKNGLLVWNVVLTLVVAYLLFTVFNKKSSNRVVGKSANKDASAGASAFRIAYFEVDSVENSLDMVKDVRAEINKKDEEYNNNVAQLEVTYKKKIQEYQSKASTMTQTDYEKAQIELKQLEESLKGRKQELDQQYQDFVTRRNLTVKKRIEEFLDTYNKTSNFSYIVAYEPGLFYYKDTAYNITNDLIRGLNVEYKSKRN